MTATTLYNSILVQAIEGHLVPQLDGEEDASVLLNRVRKRKEQLVKEKKGKADKPFDPIEESEYPIDLPRGWVFCRLGELGFYKKGPFGSALTKSMFVPKSSKSVKVYEQKNAIQKDYSLGDYYITSEYFEKMRGFEVHPGDIIVSCAGTIGETYVIPQNAPVGIINQALMRVTLADDSITDYWRLFFEYVLISSSTLKGNGSAIKNIPPFEILKNIVIPLPPIEEQRRIVNKIKSLLPQIDKFGNSQEELNNLNKILPDKLRKSVLQEAIRGRLVPQNPSDEPAIELLKRIRKEKADLVKAGRIKKKDLDSEPILSEEYPFEKPCGWEFVRLSEISLDSADGPFGSNLKKEHYTDQKQVRIIQLSNIGEFGWKDSNVKYTTFEHLKTISRSEAFAGDIIIAKMMPAGRAIICPDIDIKYVLSSDAVRFAFSSILDKRYLYYAINSPVFKDQVYGEVQGITRVRTSLSKLRTYILPIPPLSEQHRIVEKIEEVFSAIDKLKA